jgi:DtxR family Mn-dependent transcriptional regulator
MYHQLTPSQENYLEHIINKSSGDRIRVRDLAKSVGVKLPSVTRAVQKLVEAGMVRHKTYGKIEITAAGKNTARSITRRDDCLNRFLGEVLGLSPEQAKSETCRIEHVISDVVITRLELLVDHLSLSQEWKQTIEKELSWLDDNEDQLNRAEVGQTKPHT